MSTSFRDEPYPRPRRLPRVSKVSSVADLDADLPPDEFERRYGGPRKSGKPRTASRSPRAESEGVAEPLADRSPAATVGTPIAAPAPELPIRWYYRSDGVKVRLAKDVCRSFGATNSRQMMQRVPDSEKGVISVYTPGGWQKMQCITEAGINRLLLTCRKGRAADFREYLADQGVAELRRYQEGQDPPPFTQVVELLLAQTETLMSLQQQNQVLLQLNQARDAAADQSTRQISQLTETVSKLVATRDPVRSAEPLPLPWVNLSPWVIRELIRKWIQAYCVEQRIASGTTIARCYHRLYAAFARECYIQLHTHAQRRNERGQGNSSARFSIVAARSFRSRRRGSRP